MFSLNEDDLNLKILGCADGPASVNAEMYKKGKAYVSLDPIYQFTARELEQRISATAPVIAEQLIKNQTDYHWHYYQSPDQLVQIRRLAMKEFLNDFEQPSANQRYVIGSLPQLPFDDNTFDIVLCSYCLFSYSEQLNERFHCASILEMARVAREVRVFPLLEINGKQSRHLNGVLNALDEELFSRVVSVDYEFQKGGNQMLKFYKP
jgi:hypothetical protein